MRATAQGEVLWSAELPSTGVGGLAVVADGRIFLTTRGRVLAFEPGGDLLWSVEAQPRGTLAALADGHLIIPEGTSGYAVRDQGKGGLLRTIPGDWWRPGLTPEGHTAYAHTHVGEESEIRVSDLLGRLLWSAPLVEPSAVYPPLALENLVIIGDGPYLRAYDPKGTPLWIADHQKFELADYETQTNLTRESYRLKEYVRAVVWLGADRLLASFGAWGIHIFDFAAYTVRPFGAHVPFAVPAVVPWIPRKGLCLVTRTGPKPEGPLGGMTAYHIGMHDLEGQLLWEHHTGIDPDTIIADAEGKVFVACSRTFDFWEKYKRWPTYKADMEKQCFVRGLSPQGEELFTWYAGGPFSSPLAIGAAGEVYVAARGRLWAIG